MTTTTPDLKKPQQVIHNIDLIFDVIIIHFLVIIIWQAEAHEQIHDFVGNLPMYTFFLIIS